MSNTCYEFEHAVGAVLDYGFDWKKKGWLEAGEIVTSSVWTANSSDIILGTEFNEAGITTVVVSGAVLGKIYRITNSIETNHNGRKDKRTLVISCKSR